MDLVRLTLLTVLHLRGQIRSTNIGFGYGKLMVQALNWQIGPVSKINPKNGLGILNMDIGGYT